MIIITDAKGNVVQEVNPYAYTGDKYKNELKDMKVFGQDPNKIVTGTYDSLADKQVALYMTSGYAKAMVTKPLSYIIGRGVAFKSHVNYKLLRSLGLRVSEKKLRTFEKEFTKFLHLDKLSINYYKKQYKLMNETGITGDSLLFFIRDPKDPRPFDLAPIPGSDIDSTKNRKPYKLGIKTDDFMRKQGIYRRFNKKPMSFIDPKTGLQNVLIMQYADRAGQLRGFGKNIGTISTIKNLDNLLVAVEARMLQESIQMGVFEKVSTDIKRQGRDISNKQHGRQKQAIQDQTGIQEIPGSTNLNPGTMYVVRPGEGVKWGDMKAPGNNFEKAVEVIFKLACLYSGYPPQFILGEYSTSYTSAKGALNDAWLQIKRDRGLYTDYIDKTVNMQYLIHYLTHGDLDLGTDLGFMKDYRIMEALLSGVYLGEIPGTINPAQEVNAFEKAEKNGYMLKSQIASHYGNEIWDTFELWGEEQEYFEKQKPKYKAQKIQEEINREYENKNGVVL